MGIKFGPVVVVILGIFIAKISYDNYRDTSSENNREISSIQSKNKVRLKK